MDGLEAAERVAPESGEVVPPLPDLVVLDVMLPEIEGFEVLRRLRTSSDVPVVMLTARGVGHG